VSARENICPHCGARITHNAHHLTRTLLDALVAFKRAGKSHVSSAGLNHVQIANFPKLRYWGLVDKVYRRPGHWFITDHGHNFLQGKVQVFSVAWTFRGERERFDGRMVYAWQVSDEAVSRSTFAAESEGTETVPAFESGRLFD